MDPETAKKTKDFLARRDVKSEPEFWEPKPIRKSIPISITPAGMSPDDLLPVDFGVIDYSAPLKHLKTHETASEASDEAKSNQEEERTRKANKEEKKDEEKDEDIRSDVATNGSVKGDDEEATGPGIRLLGPNCFQEVWDEMDRMSKEEREAKFPYLRYPTPEGVLPSVAFDFLEEFGSI